VTGFNVLCDSRYGPILYNRRDTWMARSFALYGEYSHLEVRLLQSALFPGAVAVDAGANIGALTIPMAQVVGPTGAVLAFEPQRFMYYNLVANVALNSLTNVYPTLGALGNARGAIDVPQLDPDSENSFVGVTLDADLPRLTHAKMRPVPIMPLDDLQLARLDLLKCDVEGMELDVLKGAADTITRLSPTLYVEATFAQKRAALYAWLEAADYDVYWDTPPLFNPENFSGREDNVFVEEDGRLIISHNWLCVPRAKKIEVTGQRITPETLHFGGSDVKGWDPTADAPGGKEGAPIPTPSKVLPRVGYTGAVGPNA
jgi:FkbM family methyltransferase